MPDHNTIRAQAQHIAEQHTLKGAAKLLGVSEATLARFLAGAGGKPHRGTLIAIAHGLGLLSVASTPSIQA